MCIIKSIEIKSQELATRKKHKQLTRRRKDRKRKCVCGLRSTLHFGELKLYKLNVVIIEGQL